MKDDRASIKLNSYSKENYTPDVHSVYFVNALMDAFFKNLTIILITDNCDRGNYKFDEFKINRDDNPELPIDIYRSKNYNTPFIPSFGNISF